MQGVPLHDDLDTAVIRAPFGRRVVGHWLRRTHPTRCHAIGRDSMGREIVANGVGTLLG